VLEAGGILLPINIRLTPDEISYILNDASVAYLLIDQDFVGVLESVQSQLRRSPYVVWISGRPEGRNEPLYRSWLDDASADPPPELEIDENAVAELFYTSGTTGRPKGVMLTHRNLYLHAMTILSRLTADESDVQLHSIPLFHVNGWGLRST
jgi:fatty-acyl-CoA synthase